MAREALKRLDIDERGLDGMDREILSIIIDKFHGGPVGNESLRRPLEKIGTPLKMSMNHSYFKRVLSLVRDGEGRQLHLHGSISATDPTTAAGGP